MTNSPQRCSADSRDALIKRLQARVDAHDKMCFGSTMALGYYSGNDARLMRDAIDALRLPDVAQSVVMPLKLTGEIACILEDCSPPDKQTPEAVAALIEGYQPTWDAILAALAAQPPAAPVEAVCTFPDCKCDRARVMGSGNCPSGLPDASPERCSAASVHKRSPDECGRECAYYDYFEMLWNWFADESRNGAEDMRANMPEGLSADDFKAMLDEHEAALVHDLERHVQIATDIANEPQEAPDTLMLMQARYVLKNLHVERPGCGYDKLAVACEEAASQLSRPHGASESAPGASAPAQRPRE
jgi:hypothetical protein